MKLDTLTLNSVTLSIADGVASFPVTPELAKQIDAAKPKFEMWEPKYGAEYWFIESDGRVDSKHFQPTSRISDRNRYASGNCYPSEEIAETQGEIEQITRKLNQACAVYDGESGAYLGMYTASSRWSSTLMLPWSFGQIDVRDRFTKDFESELIRLSELSELLTTLWQAMKGDTE